jgi:hypothetical protein
MFESCCRVATGTGCMSLYAHPCQVLLGDALPPCRRSARPIDTEQYDGIEYGGLPVKSAVITLCGNHFRGPFRLGNRTLLTIAAADALAYDLACHQARGLDGIRSWSPD